MIVWLCTLYLKHHMKKHPSMEMVIRSDKKVYRKRDFKREESIKETLSKIK